MLWLLVSRRGSHTSEVAGLGEPFAEPPPLLCTHQLLLCRLQQRTTTSCHSDTACATAMRQMRIAVPIPINMTMVHQNPPACAYGQLPRSHLHASRPCDDYLRIQETAYAAWLGRASPRESYDTRDATYTKSMDERAMEEQAYRLACSSCAVFSMWHGRIATPNHNVCGQCKIPGRRTW